MKGLPTAVHGVQALVCIEACKAAGAGVKHGVDATRLQSHFAEPAFQRIIFNFPHTGQQRVHNNRNLICGFFTSARYPPRSPPERQPPPTPTRTARTTTRSFAILAPPPTLPLATGRRRPPTVRRCAWGHSHVHAERVHTVL